MAGQLVSTLKLGQEKLYECGIKIKLHAVKGNRATLVITELDGSSVILEINNPTSDLDGLLAEEHLTSENAPA